MGWNLPPGCTDKHIDDAINGDEPPMTPEEQDAEAKRMRQENDESFAELRRYIREHRGALMGLESMLALIDGMDKAMMPSPEFYAGMSDPDVEELLEDVLFELEKRKGRNSALAWCKGAMLRLSRGSPEPFLPIPHRN